MKFAGLFWYSSTTQQPKTQLMMYAILFEDNENYAGTRPKYMQEHLTFLERNAERIHSVGPLNEAKTGEPAGGLWIVEAEDSQIVQSLIESDPFRPTGLRKSFRILEWTQVFADAKRLI
jgi:uncharacterized protein YciI